ncbi:MAG: HEPN domain-containing protein [Candidatus Aenigmatarchaeota archaeon]
MSEIEDELKNAEERLSAAEILLKEDKYEDTVSRAYYSMFHAAKALLLLKDSSPRTHAGIASELGKLYREEIGPELTSKFVTVQQLREDADYGVELDIDGERVQEVLNTSKEFLSEAKRIVEES